MGLGINMTSPWPWLEFKLNSAMYPCTLIHVCFNYFINFIFDNWASFFEIVLKWSRTNQSDLYTVPYSTSGLSSTFISHKHILLDCGSNEWGWGQLISINSLFQWWVFTGGRGSLRNTVKPDTYFYQQFIPYNTQSIAGYQLKVV